ncbi:MAG: type VII toxin-antitoxin system MntA family adenylyltransferase antitoxin [Aridibacter sp.]
MNLASTEKEKIVEICRRNDISFCALFGSFARGEATKKSDIDLLIRFAKPTSLLGHIGITHELEDALEKDVDLITENKLSSPVRENVLRDLMVVYGE